jgi:RNA polymerase sigma factor, sigma-70 family
MLKKAIFEKMFNEWYAQFVYFAYYFVNDKEVSKDIVSNAFEHILEKGDKLETSTAKAYLSKIIKSKCIDYLRRQNIHSEYLKFLGHVSDIVIENDIDDHNQKMELINLYKKKLTPYNIKVLDMCYIKKMSYKEVAEELNISVAAVHKHIVVALRILRQEVKKEYKNGNHE